MWHPALLITEEFSMILIYACIAPQLVENSKPDSLWPTLVLAGASKKIQ
jgi:hypothetical protein